MTFSFAGIRGRKYEFIYLLFKWNSIESRGEMDFFVDWGGSH